MSGQPIHTFEMVVTKNNPIIRDHRVHEVRILPGVTLLDMTYRFGNKVLGHSAFTLEQVLFKQPIAAHETFDQKLRILFENRSDSTWQVQVQSRKINADQVIESPWVEIMQCRLSLLDVPATARPAPSPQTTNAPNTCLNIAVSPFHGCRKSQAGCSFASLAARPAQKQEQGEVEQRRGGAEPGQNAVRQAVEHQVPR